MNERQSWGKGDKVEITDTSHQYFGRIGLILELGQQSRTILNNPKESGITNIVKVKLEDSDTIVCFESHPKSLESQIRKL